MGKLRGLSKLISKLPTGFSIDTSTGILYHSGDNAKVEIGQVSIPEDRHYSFLIRFKDFEKQEVCAFREYWDSLNSALCREKICGGLVLIYMQFPKLG